MKAVRQHGTRAMYVAEKCRCDPCRAANRQYQQRRAQKQAAAASQVVSEVVPAPQVWTLPDGTKKVRHYKRACPGIEGKPCKTHSHLRKDSKGGICSNCRDKLPTFPVTSAKKMREHIFFLSSHGVGTKVLSVKSGVGLSTIQDVKKGVQTMVMPETAERIFAITPEDKGDASLVDGKETWRKIRYLLKRGYTKGEIALAIGNKTPALQLKKKRITMANAHSIEVLYTYALMEAIRGKQDGEECLECGLSHAIGPRLRRLRPMLPCTVEQVQDRYPCVYPRAKGGNRMLWRDLNTLEAVSVDGEWRLQAKPAPSAGEGFETGTPSTSN